MRVEYYWNFFSDQVPMARRFAITIEKFQNPWKEAHRTFGDVLLNLARSAFKLKFQTIKQLVWYLVLPIAILTKMGYTLL